MPQRFVDYGIVLGVVLLLVGLFKLSRLLLGKMISRERQRSGGFSSDMALLWGMRFLLTGLLMLPFITSLLAFADNERLAGGMPLHLAMTAISVVLFSFAEDLFRDYNRYDASSLKPSSWHWRRVGIPLLLFWMTGCAFLSPIFYSALVLLVTAFYGLCLHFRRSCGQRSGND